MENIYESEIQATLKQKTASSNQNKKFYVLDAALLEPKTKYPVIFERFDALEIGDTLELSNDYDPQPLYYQLIAIRGNFFSWTWLEKGPEVWRVQIQKTEPENNETIGQLAAGDVYKAAILRKYNIDYCCCGKKTLKQACIEKGLDLSLVQADLNKEEQTDRIRINYAKWSPDFLADYIYNNHHLYFYNESPQIADLLEKVVKDEKSSHPALGQVNALYTGLSLEIKSHQKEEETVLFPFIKYLVELDRKGDAEILQKQYSISWPVSMLEDDHADVAKLLTDLCEATNHYTVPEGASDNFRQLYEKLNALTEDLHQHIHLENNVLFPKVLTLENELRNSIL